MDMDDLDGGLTFSNVDALYTDSRRELSDGAGCDGLAASKGALVYGELTTPLRLFKALRLDSSDTFVDLGSGRGQVVLAAADATQPEIPRAVIGVEIVQARHNVAVQALKDASKAPVRHDSNSRGASSALGGSAARSTLLSYLTIRVVSTLAAAGAVRKRQD